MRCIYSKKLTAALISLLLAALFPVCAGAFSISDFDPNSGEDAVIEWYTQENDYGYEDLSDGYGSEEDPYSVGDTPSGCGTEKKIAVREPLAAEKCTPSDTYVDDDGGFFTDAQLKRLTASMAEFYEMTGVQPYLICTYDYYDASTAAVYLRGLYKELFGADGGHFILLFSECNGFQNYDIWYQLGADAQTVITYDASEQLLDYIEDCSRCGLPYEDTFCRSFEKAADYVLYGEVCDVVNDYGEEDETSVPESYTYTEHTAPAGGNAPSVTSVEFGFGHILVLAAALVLLFTVFIMTAAAVRKRKDAQYGGGTGPEDVDLD